MQDIGTRPVIWKWDRARDSSTGNRGDCVRRPGLFLPHLWRGKLPLSCIMVDNIKEAIRTPVHGTVGIPVIACCSIALLDGTWNRG